METSASVAESILEDGHAACDQPHEAASASILEQLELGGDAVRALVAPTAAACASSSSQPLAASESPDLYAISDDASVEREVRSI